MRSSIIHPVYLPFYSINIQFFHNRFIFLNFSIVDGPSFIVYTGTLKVQVL